MGICRWSADLSADYPQHGDSDCERKIPSGRKIPAVRELAAQAGVNPNTMQRALTELEREGLLYSRRTSGRFVTENESTIREARRTLAEQFISEMFKNLENLGMKRGEIIEAIDHWKE